MYKNLWETILSIDRTILAAFISGGFTLLSSGVLAVYISKYLIRYQNKLEEKQRERAEFLSPSKPKILNDSQKLIKYTKNSFNVFLSSYYYEPLDFIRKINITHNTSEEEVETKIRQLLLSDYDKDIISRFDLLRNQSFPVFYCFYFSITPGLTYSKLFTLIHQHFPFDNEIPLPHPKIKELSEKIFDKIISTIWSHEFNLLLELFKDPNTKFLEQKSRFNMFWLQITNEFIKEYQELEDLFISLWSQDGSRID